MPVTKDKRRNKYVARLTHNGTRHYIGAYDSEKVAQTALDVRKKMLERLDSTTLDDFQLEYDDKGLRGRWRKKIGSWIKK